MPELLFVVILNRSLYLIASIFSFFPMQFLLFCCFKEFFSGLLISSSALVFSLLYTCEYMDDFVE